MSSASIRTLIKILEQSQRIVCFTGAGISTESGIPDFRSPGTGLWHKIKPIPFQDFINSEAARRLSWQQKFSGRLGFETANPNRGHRYLADLVNTGKCTAIITQNVDNLHQNSGVPENQVIELHGNTSYATCLNCKHHYELTDLRKQFEMFKQIPPCQNCGGIIKTATISFGQSMPKIAMARAEAAITQCDLCLVLGSSLSVHPAADFPAYAKQLGAKLAIINREATPLDHLADVVISAEIGSITAELAAAASASDKIQDN